MPWSPADAKGKTKSATTATKRRQWSDIANSIYAKIGDEASAIKQANGVLKKERK